jgi:hypothetical protein
MNTVLSCLWYSPIVPYALPFAVIAIFLNYWVTKYMVAYWYKKPDNYGPALVSFFTNLMPTFTIVWALGMLYFFE